MVQKRRHTEITYRQNETILVKKLIRVNLRQSKIDEEKHALNSLDNLLILTFFSILFPTILQFTTLRLDYLIILVTMLALIFLFTFKGIAENNIKYRIWAWLWFLLYINLIIFNLIVSEYFPRERGNITYTEDKIILTNIYNNYNLFPWFAVLLISGYFCSKAMIYIIQMYIKRAPISSKQTIDKMLSNPRAGIDYLLFFNDRKVLLLGLFLLIISVILFINGKLWFLSGDNS